MKLEMVGSGSAFGEGLNSSGYILIHDRLIIIDCGDKMVQTYEKLLPKLIQENEIKNIKFVITHTHPDHLLGLPSIIMFLSIFHSNINIEIIAGTNQNYIEQILSISGLNYTNKLFYSTDTTSYVSDNGDRHIEIKLTPNKHKDKCFKNKNHETYSVLIAIIDYTSKEKYRLYYSGDTPTFRLQLNLNSENILDDLRHIITYPEDLENTQFFHEVAFYDGCEGTHTSYKDILILLTKMIHPKLREKLSDKLVLYHCDFNKVIKDFYEAKDLEALRDIELLNKYSKLLTKSDEGFIYLLNKYIKDLEDELGVPKTTTI